MKNNKGFSLVELLAAVVILGLLSTIAIVSVSAILNKAEKNHYDTQQKNIVMAAQSYAQDNRNILPKE
ncbi:MAG: type II secretion system protein, partial [bacterium]|nr:type II secretion system protein [bacterium]